jgi:hypothetical protein
VSANLPAAKSAAVVVGEVVVAGDGVPIADGAEAAGGAVAAGAAGCWSWASQIRVVLKTAAMSRLSSFILRLRSN